MLVAKVLRPDCATDPHALRDLAREAALLERLAHPVARALLRRRAPTAASRTWCSSTWKGRRSTSWSRATAPLALEQVLPLALHVASALHYLAAEGVVHLDVKPSNIVMGAPPRLIDLSVARTFAEAAARARPDRHRRLHGARAARSRTAARPARRRLRPRGDAPRRADRRAVARRSDARAAPHPSAPASRPPHAARRPANRPPAPLRRAGEPPAATPRRSPGARPRRCATSSRRARPRRGVAAQRAGVRRGARAARRRAAAAAHARTPLVTLCGGWTAATALAAGTLLGALVLVALHFWRGIEYWNYSEGVYAYTSRLFARRRRPVRPHRRRAAAVAVPLRRAARWRSTTR